jgi:hypothetical protein
MVRSRSSWRRGTSQGAPPTPLRDEPLPRRSPPGLAKARCTFGTSTAASTASPLVTSVSSNPSARWPTRFSRRMEPSSQALAQRPGEAGVERAITLATPAQFVLRRAEPACVIPDRDLERRNSAFCDLWNGARRRLGAYATSRRELRFVAMPSRSSLTEATNLSIPSRSSVATTSS